MGPYDMKNLQNYLQIVAKTHANKIYYGASGQIAGGVLGKYKK